MPGIQLPGMLLLKGANGRLHVYWNCYRHKIAAIYKVQVDGLFCFVGVVLGCIGNGRHYN